MWRRGRSSHRSHHPVRLSLPSRHHSTAAPSMKRYEMRYEAEVRDLVPQATFRLSPSPPFERRLYSAGRFLTWRPILVGVQLLANLRVENLYALQPFGGLRELSAAWFPGAMRGHPGSFRSPAARRASWLIGFSELRLNSRHLRHHRRLSCPSSRSHPHRHLGHRRTPALRTTASRRRSGVETPSDLYASLRGWKRFRFQALLRPPLGTSLYG
jgi:hypothetical protein